MLNNETKNIFIATLRNAIRTIDSRAAKPEHTDVKSREAFVNTLDVLNTNGEFKKSDIFTLQLAILTVTKNIKENVQSLVDAYNYYTKVLKKELDEAADAFDEGNWEEKFKI